MLKTSKIVVLKDNNDAMYASCNIDEVTKTKS